MAISFDAALGVHDDALALRARRAEVLANNIANADTPNYKARDLDFAAILAGQGREFELPMERTESTHQSEYLEPDMAADLLFRTPHQPSVDGNTVELQEEMARYTDNAIRYQASFQFLNSKFQGLTRAIKGE
ncbi:flagellar basal body rod protein FlgB [Marinobacterium sediminicola]|uniref:Flagellar basal body rod protein FlgB n=1 Tax=Marinobacterium sediminicola TaxID=518898 RepID=A0ABY1RYE0_9GAMM|nr:flagellar basal body rod protein FlgB [Marinobacterium sediminicola]ULG68802.1 flagellar basal body rod protein FlgB [Marinobacterium sediminicola]SMR73332.1 flagellar basal-body rod protein FlgB [Marinobacterium sediminicola]